MPNMRSSRFSSLGEGHSLRHLRTAFGPSSLARSISSTSSTSPLSPTTSSSSRFSGLNFNNLSSISLARTLDMRRIIRRKKSMVEVEQEEERTSFNGELVGLVEPRPMVGVALGGIEEVLDGSV